MEAFADVVEQYAPLNKGHITTRQNIQIHHVPLADAAELIREISEAGLSSREGCGNTIRNVTGDPWAGVADDEPFDITPYAAAYVRYFVRHPTTQLMPRKVKTAFTASDADRAITGIHDVGFIPKSGSRRQAGEGVEIRIGGGTSIMPRIAPTLYDFVELDNGDYLKVTEAALRIFDRQEWLRENRMRARIKVLVDKIGMDAFREMVEEELEGDWVDERDFSIDHLRFVHDEEANAPAVPRATARRTATAASSTRWVEANVEPQRQDGFVDRPRSRSPAATSPPSSSAASPRSCATSPAATRGRPCSRTWSCAGSATSPSTTSGCGSRSSTWATPAPSRSPTWSAARAPTAASSGSPPRWGSTRRSQERLEEMKITDPLTKQIHIKMSGCPNGCGQHHIATIGFYGASIKVGDHTIPAYIPHIAGSFEGGDVAFGQRLKARLPAKRVPDAVERWIRHYEEKRNDGENFNDFVERTGTDAFEELISDLKLPVEFNAENLLHFIDWNRSEPYKVERGEGECAV